MARFPTIEVVGITNVNFTVYSIDNFVDRIYNHADVLLNRH